MSRPRTGRHAHHAAAGRRIDRRTLLADLGRVTLGAVVLGPALAACTGGDDRTGDAEDEATGSDQPSASASDPAGASAAPSASSTGGGSGSAAGQRWERASYGFVSAYVVVRDGEAVVFDSGTADGGAEPITAALDALGLGWDAVSTVLVSHEHGDHVGGLADVAASATEAVVLAARPDLDTVVDRLGDTGRESREVTDGEAAAWLRVVSTPGHTAGHVSAFDEDTGLLLAGDAIVNGVTIGGTTGDGIEVSPPEFTADATSAGESVDVLAALAPATILFGHGEPVTEGAAEALAAVEAAA